MLTSAVHLWCTHFKWRRKKSFLVLQALSRLNTCRQIYVSAIDMRQCRRGSALIMLVASPGVHGNIGAAKGVPSGHVPPIFRTVILCFETLYSEQNTVARLKPNILPPNFLSPPLFGLATSLNGWFCMGAESCQWISMQSVAPLYPKCAISQTMKIRRSISNELQYKAKQDLIQISKKISNEILVI